ncbi:hypothetical protein [Mycolicibacterium gilvum]|uniref:hypothetical protein n=1 Tax=Mycolicibacterium gilvum TaxID=1804 RepID=UPI0040459A9C
MSASKSLIKRGLQRIKYTLKPPKFDTSATYWENRYRTGGTSGSGSYNRLAQFKAQFINQYVAEHNIRTIIEFGSGDGAQLELAAYPQYVGIDISTSAIEATRLKYQADTTKIFLHASEYDGRKAELALSLDVIYHLVEDDVFATYMQQLFNSASHSVIVYASNDDNPSTARHVRHRKFTRWVENQRPDFTLTETVSNPYPYLDEDPDNTSFADFFVFTRND